jgi:serine/threonine protein kinase
MTSEDWLRIGEVYASVRHLNDGQRRQAIDELCGEDRELALEVASLLENTEAADREGLLVPPTERDPGQAPDEEWPCGTRIGAYEIRQTIGHGGMGTVYRAVRVQGDGQEVAIKAIRVSVDPQGLRRFHLERQLLAELDHPNIVRPIDGGTAPDGSPYLVMEYVHGRQLDAYCLEEGLTIRQRAQLVRDLSCAVAHAHDHGVIHRDLKPANILVDAAGTAKITDFGIARSTRRGERITAPGVIIGTPGYMAPEQVRAGWEHGGPAVDCYGLGATLYRLLTGRHPYETESPFDAYLRVTSEDPTPVRKWNRDVPPDLETIVMKAMARDPSERFLSEADIAEELRRFLAGEPLSIRRPSSVTRLARWAIQHHRALGAWTTSVLILLLATVGIVQAQKLRLARALDEESRQRRLAESRRDALGSVSNHLLLASEDLARFMQLGTPEARQYFKRLVEMYESVQGQDASVDRNPRMRHGVAQAQFQLARALEAAGTAADREESVVRFGQAIEILQSLAAENPRSPWFRYDLARALKCRGIAHVNAGSAEQLGLAQRDHADSLEAFQALARDFPDDPRWRNAAADQLLELAALLGLIGRKEEARRRLEQAVEVVAPLARSIADPPIYRRTMSQALRRVASLDFTTGRLESAECSGRKAMKLDDELARAWPREREYRLQAADIRARLADNLRIQGRTTDSLSLLSEAQTAVEGILADFPDYQLAIVLQMNLHTFVARTRLAAARTVDEKASAERAFRACTENFEAAVRAHPDMDVLQTELGSLYAGCSVPALRRPDGAIAILRPRVEHQMGASVFLGEALCRAGRWQEAEALAKPWADRLRGQDEACPFAYLLAWSLARLGDREQASRWFREAETVARANRYRRDAHELIRQEAEAAIAVERVRP